MINLLPIFFALQSAAQPLPEHADIPEQHSTVICPDQKSADAMMAGYYRVNPAPNNHTIDVDHFFEGLRATGCSQDGEREGVITIRSVKARLEIALADSIERMVQYEGVDQSGRKIIGIVDEVSNNGYPRTELAEWLSVRSENGWLDAGSGDAPQIFYRCAAPDQAKAVVSALKGMEKATEQAFQAKLEKAAATQGCRKASDRYMVTALLESAGNECGFECYIDVTALTAIDRSGMQVGLIYDGALM